MLDSSGSRGEKLAWSRARRWSCFLLLLLVAGSLTLTFYASRSAASWPTWPAKLWSSGSWRSQRYHGNASAATAAATAAAMAAAASPYYVAYPRRYDFLLDEPGRCARERPFLVLMIPVAPRDVAARDAIRRTYGRQTAVLGHVVARYFLLGLSRETDGVQEQLLAESRLHGDVLQSDFVDSYNNLTLKTMMMLEWLTSRCPNASYAMKIDSDVFLNVRNLVALLLNAPRRRYMTGMVAWGASVLRDATSKWFLPASVFPESAFPPYALGLGYVFSLDLAGLLVAAAPHVKPLYIEDVYVGLCMRHLGVTPFDPPHGDLFLGVKPASPGRCYWTNVITTILDNAEQLEDAWAELQDSNATCR